jgi:predicted ATPase
VQAAAEAAEEFGGGVWWVALAPLRDAQLFLPSVAAALGIQAGEGAVAAIAGALAPGRGLFVLDNTEHLLPALAGEVAALCEAVDATFLATSREPLQAAGEHVYRVSPLTARDATSLFVTRAGQHGVVVAADGEVEELCTRLDRLPLAIELAAARVSLLTPSQLLARVGERLDLLKGGPAVDPRQRTLRATIEWSYELLADDERRLFEALSVFAGGCTYEAAERVCRADPDSLQSLIEKSLLRRRDTGAEPRYWMLETIREYASLRLEEHGAGAAARRRHATYYVELAERAGQELAAGDAGRWRWLERLDQDLGNLRAMLQFTAAGDPERHARACAALWRYWVSRDVSEGLPWLERALEEPSTPETRASLLYGTTVLAMAVGNLDAAQAAALERSELSRQVGDDRGLAETLVQLGALAGDVGDFAQARATLEDAVTFARKADDRTILAGALGALAYLALRQGSADEAATLSLEAVGLWRRLHRDDQVVVSLINRASALLALGEVEQARSTLHEALRLAAELRSKDQIAYCLDGLSALAAEIGDARRAALLVGAADAIRLATGTIREPYERDVSERTQTELRAALGDEYAELLVAGGALPVERAVAYALGEEPALDRERPL